MDIIGPPPQVPPRHSSDNSGKNNNNNFWRQSLGVFLAFLIVLAVLFSTACLIRYALRDKTVYDELVDYLDKTISISKINYNRALGLYEVTEQEQGALHLQRKYKNLVWAFLGSDLLNYVFFATVIALFYGANVNMGLPHIVFWVTLVIGIVYSLLQVSVFTVLIFPLSAKLPNETSTLLDHAIPHNPGGLLQMEHSIGCTFDHNLYNALQRRANANNTCDPYIARSYIPRPLLLSFIALRLAALLTFGVTLLLRFSCGSLITTIIDKTRPKSGQKTRFSKNPHPGKTTVSALHTPKSTTFGVKGAIGDPPATPPINVDHTISYNNAAFIATNGGLNSSRSSEISADIVNYRPPTHQSNSLISEV